MIRYPLLVALGLVHVMQGLSLIFAGTLVHPTPVVAVLRFINEYLGTHGLVSGMFMTTAGVLAIVAQSRFDRGWRWRLAFIPQFFVLLMASAGAIKAVVLGVYPDGYAGATSLYIAEDQVHWPLIAAMYVWFLVRR